MYLSPVRMDSTEQWHIIVSPHLVWHSCCTLLLLRTPSCVGYSWLLLVNTVAQENVSTEWVQNKTMISALHRKRTTERHLLLALCGLRSPRRLDENRGRALKDKASFPTRETHVQFFPATYGSRGNIVAWPHPKNVSTYTVDIMSTRFVRSSCII